MVCEVKSSQFSNQQIIFKDNLYRKIYERNNMRKVPTLEQIRARLNGEENNRGGNRPSGGGDNSYYAFWNTPENGQTVLRFLPDNDETNEYFWVEKLHINLTFAGVKGQSHDPVTVRVPCVEMYGDPCPILAEIRPMWKDPTLEEVARRYWKKRSYLFQGFVVSSGFAEETTPENPIRKFNVSPGIYDKIKSALLDTDFEDNPTDFIGGRNFRLRKTKKGQFPNYDTSMWIPREEALTSEQLEAIDKYGLNNLKDMLPKKPSSEELEIIFDMFKDSLDDMPYDTAKYGQYFRPYGVSAPANSTIGSSRIRESVKEELFDAPKETVSKVQDEDSSDSSSGEDIAAIIARVNASRRG